MCIRIKENPQRKSVYETKSRFLHVLISECLCVLHTCKNFEKKMLKKTQQFMMRERV